MCLTVAAALAMALRMASSVPTGDEPTSSTSLYVCVGMDSPSTGTVTTGRVKRGDRYFAPIVHDRDRPCTRRWAVVPQRDVDGGAIVCTPYRSGAIACPPPGADAALLSSTGSRNSIA